MHSYFETYKYSNTQSSQLWEVFYESSEQKIDVFMKTWIEEPGFPCIFVIRKFFKLNEFETLILIRLNRLEIQTEN
jgi:hypothetical protein